jgi:hypothetical protein
MASGRTENRCSRNFRTQAKTVFEDCLRSRETGRMEFGGQASAVGWGHGNSEPSKINGLDTFSQVV